MMLVMLEAAKVAAAAVAAVVVTVMGEAAAELIVEVEIHQSFSRVRIHFTPDQRTHSASRLIGEEDWLKYYP